MILLNFRYLSKNKHVRHIQHYVATCSIGDWFVLYQMSKNMNKRFFAEFLALLSLKVNPDPDANDDAEIDIVKQIFAHSHNDSPSAPEIPAKFPDDSSVDFYDEEESTGGSCTSSCKENTGLHQEARNRSVLSPNTSQSMMSQAQIDEVTSF